MTGNTKGTTCCNEAWEEAYARFETPEDEIRKFTRRLLRVGAGNWKKDAAIVEIFCGRGNGLHALSRLGFTQLEGVDLSASLLAQYKGPALCRVADCRQLPFASQSRDILIVQGGLHHLHTLPGDLGQVLKEVRRILRPDGQFIVVEPWLTPFLSFVHALCRNALARKLSRKIDALSIMTENERDTYQQWLSQPDAIMALFRRNFQICKSTVGWGKLTLIASPNI